METLAAVHVQRVRGTRNQSSEALIQAYAKHADVEYVEPDYIYTTQIVPNDLRFAEMWGLNNIGQTGGTAVDDMRGWDFANNDNNPMDDQGHGTHTAGTVGAVGNNATGVTGVAWQVKIMPLKFLAANGGGSALGAARAILYASAMGAKISNNSWGGGSYSQTIENAIATANQRGMLFVVAAGNVNANNDAVTSYPCNSPQPNVLCVAATDHNDNKASFSNYGAVNVDLGAAALVLAQFPDFTPIDIKNRVMQTVDKMPSLAGRTVTGGRLNVDRAVTAP